MIEYRCECGKWFEVPDEIAGKQVECYACGKIGRVSGIPKNEALAPVAALPALELPSFGEIFGRAWKIYKNKIFTLLGLLLITIVFLLLSPSGMLLSIYLGKFLKNFEKPLVLSGFLGTFLLLAFSVSWSMAASFYCHVPGIRTPSNPTYRDPPW